MGLWDGMEGDEADHGRMNQEYAKSKPVSQDNLPRDEDGNIIPFEQWSRDMDSTFGKMQPWEVRELAVVIAVIAFAIFATAWFVTSHADKVAPHVQNIQEQNIGNGN